MDDHHDFRTAARALLEADGFEVVGEAGTGADAVAAVEQLHPGAVLLDVRLPDLDGFAVAEQLATLVEPPQVVLVSSRGTAAWQSRLQSAAVCGFVAKSELSGEAVRRLLAPTRPRFNKSQSESGGAPPPPDSP